MTPPNTRPWDFNWTAIHAPAHWKKRAIGLKGGSKDLKVCFSSSFPTISGQQKLVIIIWTWSSSGGLWAGEKDIATKNTRVIDSRAQGIKSLIISMVCPPPPNVTDGNSLFWFPREVLTHSFVSHMWSNVRLSEGSGCAILPSRTLGHNTLLLMTVARIKACDVSAGVLHWWEFGSWSGARGPTVKYSQEKNK